MVCLCDHGEFLLTVADLAVAAGGDVGLAPGADVGRNVLEACGYGELVKLDVHGLVDASHGGSGVGVCGLAGRRPVDGPYSDVVEMADEIGSPDVDRQVVSEVPADRHASLCGAAHDLCPYRGAQIDDTYQLPGAL